MKKFINLFFLLIPLIAGTNNLAAGGEKLSNTQFLNQKLTISKLSTPPAGLLPNGGVYAFDFAKKEIVLVKPDFTIKRLYPAEQIITIKKLNSGAFYTRAGYFSERGFYFVDSSGTKTIKKGVFDGPTGIGIAPSGFGNYGGQYFVGEHGNDNVIGSDVGTVGIVRIDQNNNMSLFYNGENSQIKLYNIQDLEFAPSNFGKYSNKILALDQSQYSYVDNHRIISIDENADATLFFDLSVLPSYTIAREIEFNHKGELFLLTNNGVYQIDTSATFTIIDTTGKNYYSFAFDNNDRIWVMDIADSTLKIIGAANSNTPNIVVNKNQVVENVNGNISVTDTLIIKNTGNADLTFSINDTTSLANIRIQNSNYRRGDLQTDFNYYVIKNARNELRNVGWLTEYPLSGTILPGDSVKIFLTFNSTGLPSGEYNAHILINSNDPDEPVKIVKATLIKNLKNITTIDNENNSLEGIPDYDLDAYLFNTSSISPIEFNIFINETQINTAELLIYAWDIDETSGEVDEVYVNGHLVGTLTGANGQWSSTDLNIDPSFLNPGPNGKNLIQIKIDVNGHGYWAVNVDFGQLIINGKQNQSTANIRYVKLNKSIFSNKGDTVVVKEEIDTKLAIQKVKVETNILDTGKVNIDGTSRVITISDSLDEPFNEVFYLPSNIPEGTYYVQVIVYDDTTFIVQDSKLLPFIVSSNKPPATPQNLTATAGDKKVILSWRANTESDLAGYNIYYRTDTTNTFAKLATVNKPDTSYIHTGLTNGVTYYYKITAVDSAGNESGYSNIVTATPKLPSIKLSYDQIDAQHFPTITSYVTVFGEQNKPLFGLTEKNFKVFEDNVLQLPITVMQLNQGQVPMSVALVIDKSGSMSGQKMTSAKQAANQFIDSLKIRDRGAVISFSNTVTIDAAFTSDKGKLKDAVNKIISGGMTAIYDAVDSALTMTARENQRKAVILLTDGEDNSSGKTLDEEIAYAQKLNIPIHTIGLGIVQGSTAENNLKRLAQETGGRYYYAPTANDLASLYRSLSQQLKAQYLISYKTLNTTLNGKKRRVTIQATYNASMDTASRYYKVGKPAIIPPEIIEITDVPNDNGRRVFVRWRASINEESLTNPVVKYSIWRKDSSWWTYAGEVPPRGDSVYAAIVTTLYDSTKSKGMHWTVFQVTAHGNIVGTYSSSLPDSGYSLDNLAPHTPDSLRITITNSLIAIKWSKAKEKDFQYYAIYRDTVATINPDKESAIAYSKENSYKDKNIIEGKRYYYRIVAVDFSGNRSKPSKVIGGLVTGVKEKEIMPKKYRLTQNYPNPFNPTTTIKYEIPKAGNVRIVVYNALGEKVRELVNGYKQPGVYTVEFNANNLPSGIYIYRMQADKFQAVKKLILLK